jgi:hypothetical protein
VIVSFGDDSLGPLLSSTTSMTAMWGGAARQVQVLVTLLVAAPFLGDLLAMASVRVRAMPSGAMIQRGSVEVTAQVLGHGGVPLPLEDAAFDEATRATHLRVDEVRVLATVGERA